MSTITSLHGCGAHPDSTHEEWLKLLWLSTYPRYFFDRYEAQGNIAVLLALCDIGLITDAVPIPSHRSFHALKVELCDKMAKLSIDNDGFDSFCTFVVDYYNRE